MQDKIQEFIAALAADGVDVEDSSQVIADDTVRRCHMVGDKKGEPSITYKLEVTADGFGFGWAVPWRMGGERIDWHSKAPRGRAKEVTAAAREWQARQREAQRAEREEQARSAVAETERRIAEAAAAVGHPYLTRKGVDWLDGLQHEGLLVVPVTSAAGLVGCQLIAADGRRWFQKGTPKKAAWHFLAGDLECGIVAMVEGLSTGLTVRAATGWPVYVAIDAGNLRPVAVEVKRMHPNAVIVIAGDNDLWKRDDKGQPLNTGKKCAEQAAGAIGGAVVMLPEGLDHPGTDWNDAAAQKGVDWVRECLSRVRVPEPVDVGPEPDYSDSVDMGNDDRDIPNLDKLRRVLKPM